MTCEEVRDLIPAYTLGTATVTEIATIENHLVECDLHDDLAGLRAVAILLGASAESIVPPEALKERIISRAAGSRVNDSRVIRPTGIRRYRRLMLANPLAAMLVVALGVMVVWNITLMSAESLEKFVHYYWGNDNDWMRIETVLGDSGAAVSLGGVERLDDTHRYHLWTTRGDEILFVGEFNVNPEGKWAGEFDFVFEEGDRVWMTQEPASGSEQPTGEAVLKTRF